MTSHARFTVRTASHEQDPARTAWRIQHAAGTIGVVAAYFTRDEAGEPVQADNGTFEIHAPSRTTLGTLRQMITEHEGLTLVTEDEAPGHGIAPDTLREMRDGS
jgi:hypothetical protein